jgi:hypothetical protein
MTKENTMTIWRLERWDWASCGEHTEVAESWLFTTKEKAEAKKLEELAGRQRYTSPPGYDEKMAKKLANNLMIEKVEVL